MMFIFRDSLTAYQMTCCCSVSKEAASLSENFYDVSEWSEWPEPDNSADWCWGTNSAAFGFSVLWIRQNIIDLSTLET